MDSLRSPSGSVRRHGRQISHSIPQPAARGPLDEGNDPLADPLPASSPVGADDAHVTSIAKPQEMTSSPPPPQPPEKPAVNLKFLQDPRIYNAIPTDDIPNAFLTSDNRPSAGTSLPDLLQAGHFRRAADAAIRALLQRPPDAAEQILQLLYTRLACLILISCPDIAAHEAAPLENFIARSSAEANAAIAVIPWELRLLLIRLQSIGAPDGGRRSVMSLYALAGEARTNLRDARASGDAAAVDLWGRNLRDLGLRVCDVLVEMGELETATRHLDTLQGINADEMAYRKALLRIRVGDISGARKCASTLTSRIRKREFETLLQTSDGDHEGAARSLQDLMEEYPSHELFAQNAAVSLLYTGHITSARDVLEDLSMRLPMFPALLFNLSTVYELCTERSAERKTALIHRTAAKQAGPESGGWERAAIEFKL